MARQDPHSYAELTQGKISQINLRIKVDFNTQILMGRMPESVEG